MDIQRITLRDRLERGILRNANSFISYEGLIVRILEFYDTLTISSLLLCSPPLSFALSLFFSFFSSPLPLLILLLLLLLILLHLHPLLFD